MKLKVFFIEVFIVVIGVSLAFFGETKRQQYLNKQLEHKYIKALKADLSHNLEQTRSRIAEDSIQVTKLNQVKSALQSKNFKQDSLGKALTYMLFARKISFHQTTYQEIINSSNMDVFVNDSIRHMIIDYFDYYDGVKFTEDHSMNMLSNLIIPYISSNFSILDFLNKEMNSKLNSKAINDDEFYNLLLMISTYTEDKIFVYNQFIEKHNKLISAINNNYN